MIVTKENAAKKEFGEMTLSAANIPIERATNLIRREFSQTFLKFGKKDSIGKLKQAWIERKLFFIGLPLLEFYGKIKVSKNR